MYDPAAYAAVPAPKSKRGLILGIVGGVVGLALIGGGAWALISVIGGGSSVDVATVLPAEPIAVISVDLSLEGDQAAGAAAFIERLPDSDGFDSETLDSFWEGFFSTTALDYATDVKPWLGDSLAASLLAGADGQPGVVIALASRDDAAARAAGEKILAGTGVDVSDPANLTIRSGYLLVSPTGSIPAEGAAALSTNAEYLADLALLGELGPVVLWQDSDGLVEFTQAVTQSLGGLPVAATPTELGRAAVTLRFAGGDLEVYGRTIGAGVSPVAAPSSERNIVSTLPDTTALVLSIDGVGPAVQEIWNRAEEFLGTDASRFKADAREFFTNYGINPDTDLAVIFGTELAVAVDQAGVNELGMEPTGIAVLVATDAQRSQSLLQPLLNDLLASGGAPITWQASADIFTIGFGQAYVASVAGATGALGSDPVFVEAVPNAATADAILFIDATHLGDLARDGLPAEVAAMVSSFEALGASANRIDGGNDYEYLLKLTTVG